MNLTDKKIILGICGGIAAYKSCEWVRLLQKEGADVRVIMTRAATRFVAPLTFAALSRNRVYDDMFSPSEAENIPHISLARDCDLILIAPATAQTIARLAHGMADDLLTTVVLATKAKVLVCPAMNCNMYLHPATQANISRLQEYDYRIVLPEEGEMACGDKGPGRLPDWRTVRHEILSALCEQDLAGYSITVTAGPTVEPIDPVRFITNYSSGKMGYAVAQAACERGAAVTLVSGPTNLPEPAGVKTISVKSAAEMYDAVMTVYQTSDIIIKTAAVADYSSKNIASGKIKKSGRDMRLELTPNRDILAELGAKKKKSKHKPILVGFAAESADHLQEGGKKLVKKNLDLIVINDIMRDDAGFAADTNQVTILDANGAQTDLPLLSKEDTAHKILDRIVDIL